MLTKVKMGTQAELVSELKGWCRGETLDEAHVVMIITQEDVSTDTIEETMQSVKCLGHVRVRGRIFNLQHNKYHVLCECKEEVKGDMVPPEVFPTQGGGPWPVITTDPRALASGRSPAEAQPVENLSTLFPAEDAAAKSTEAILRAVSDLLDKTSRSSSEHGSYRRLRVFSAISPTLPGEEQFDHWLGQARLMVEECYCSLKEKRRRLMESLRGPALDIVKSARASDPDVSPEDCLEALEHAFGTAESGEELYFAFRLLQQQSGEKLSDFLRRLEQSLGRVVQRGGISPGYADKARLEQLLRGAVASDLMLVNLRLRERKEKPPTFLQLLKEIRTEEDCEASRRQLAPVVHGANQQKSRQSKSKFKS